MLRQIADGDHVTRAEAFIDTRNQPSIRLVTRLGFRQVRTIENADHFKGSSSDEVVFEKSPL